MSASARFTVPPPPGISCECEVECACVDLSTCPHEPSHWHQRFMGMACDECDDDFQADVFAYTRAGAYEAIRQIAQERGWSITQGINYALCPTCSTDDDEG